MSDQHQASGVERFTKHTLTVKRCPAATALVGGAKHDKGKPLFMVCYGPVQEGRKKVSGELAVCSGDDAEANAHLYAAAPETYAALRAMNEAFLIDNTAMTPAQQEAARLTISALSKALGKEKSA